MEGGDGERVTRRRMKEGARRAAVKGGKKRFSGRELGVGRKIKGAKYEKERT